MFARRGSAPHIYPNNQGLYQVPTLVEGYNDDLDQVLSASDQCSLKRAPALSRKSRSSKTHHEAKAEDKQQYQPDYLKVPPILSTRRSSDAGIVRVGEQVAIKTGANSNNAALRGLDKRRPSLPELRLRARVQALNDSLTSSRAETRTETPFFEVSDESDSASDHNDIRSETVSYTSSQDGYSDLYEIPSNGIAIDENNENKFNESETILATGSTMDCEPYSEYYIESERRNYQQRQWLNEPLIPFWITEPQYSVPFQVRIDLSAPIDDVYVSGETMHGQINITTDNIFQCDSFQVELLLLGYEEMAYSILGSVENRVLFYKWTETYLPNNFSGIAPDGQHWTVRSGRMACPFTVSLDEGLPSGIVTPFGSIRYSLIVSVKSQMKENIWKHASTYENINIVAKESHHDWSEVTKVYSAQKQLLLGGPGFLRMAVTPKSGKILAGDSVSLSVTLTNLTERTVRYLTVTLIQMVYDTVSKTKIGERTLSSFIFRGESYKCRPRSVKTLELDVNVPGHVRSIENAPILSVTYEWSVQAGTHFNKDLIVRVPLFVYHARSIQNDKLM